MPALQCQYLVPVNVCVAGSVAQLDEARKKVEEEKAAAEEARTVQQLLDNAKVSCLTGRFLDLFQVGPAPPKENVLVIIAVSFLQEGCPFIAQQQC